MNRRKSPDFLYQERKTTGGRTTATPKSSGGWKRLLPKTPRREPTRARKNHRTSTAAVVIIKVTPHRCSRLIIVMRRFSLGADPLHSTLFHQSPNILDRPTRESSSKDETTDSNSPSAPPCERGVLCRRDPRFWAVFVFTVFYSLCIDSIPQLRRYCAHTPHHLTSRAHPPRGRRSRGPCPPPSGGRPKTVPGDAHSPSVTSRGCPRVARRPSALVPRET